MSLTKAQTAQIMQMLSIAFPLIEMTKERVELWHECMHDLEFDDVHSAVMDYLKTESKFPAIADIYQRAVKIREKREKAEKAKRDAEIVEQIRQRELERVKREIAEGVYDVFRTQGVGRNEPPRGANARDVQ
ncbi:replicative helicase loader/inhibitor [Alicyclobacillus sendaiensis]|uniref:replicative helicase loader/inhibitor n=1 Tax=Alicyclobacillus sendaiensis TaxID=192387 RepID=UPI0026F47DC4|nr:replicative helicase loader/inhibitor [Alicyclobacillus sendaiensis]